MCTNAWCYIHILIVTILNIYAYASKFIGLSCWYTYVHKYASKCEQIFLHMRQRKRHEMHAPKRLQQPPRSWSAESAQRLRYRQPFGESVADARRKKPTDFDELILALLLLLRRGIYLARIDGMPCRLKWTLCLPEFGKWEWKYYLSCLPLRARHRYIDRHDAGTMLWSDEWTKRLTCLHRSTRGSSHLLSRSCCQSEICSILMRTAEMAAADAAPTNPAEAAPTDRLR